MRKIAIEDYQFMLESAEEHLDDIETLYNEALKLDYVPKKLTNRIRYFLNDIESALDYISFEVFTTYCLPEILKSESDPSKIEQRKKRVNFPLYDYPEPFKKRTKEMFPKLNEIKPEIIQIFESHQPFTVGNKDYWLPTFNKLNNHNKHRKLTKQTKRKRGHVKHMEIMGIKFTNSTFDNVGEIAVINGKPIDPSKPNPFTKNYAGKIETYFIFNELNIPVLETLNGIYSGTITVISDTENSLEGD